MEYKYCLIVSQYYHSYHMFIVKIEDDFIEKGRKFTKELCKYKRSNNDNEKFYAGDFNEKYRREDGKLRPRYNVNDAGDIYFINSTNANALIYSIREQIEHERQMSVGYKRKAVIEKIYDHHNYGKIKGIVEKYFNLA